MVAKRNRDGTAKKGGSGVTEPAIPYIIFKTAQEVRDGLGARGRHALVSLRKQIFVPPSYLPVPIYQPNVVLIQHYIGLSPAFDEVFKAWRAANEGKDSSTIAAAMELLATLLQLINPLPYFRSTTASVVSRVTANGEVFGQSLNRMIQSKVRDHAQAGLALAAACMQAELPDLQSSSRSKKGSKVWDCLLEGGAVKVLPKLLSMRRKGGFAKDADPLDKPDIRHLALEVIMPLLGHVSFAQSARQIMRPFWSNIREDPSRTILRILTGVWRAISTQPTPAMNRKVSLTLLDEATIESLMKLFARRDSDEEIHGYNPSEMAYNFLLATCTKPGTGICFPDEGWYRRKGKGKASDMAADAGAHDGPSSASASNAGSGLHNRILANVLRKIGPKTVEDGQYASLVEAILRACPELVAGYWPSSGLSLEPRLTSQWISTISFVGRIVSLPVPPIDTFRTIADPPTRKASPPSLQAVIEATLPSPLTKQHLSKALQHQSALVQHLAALTIARSLQKIAAIRELFTQLKQDIDSAAIDESEDAWSELLRDLEMELRKRLPEVAVVVGFAQKSASSQAIHAADPEADTEATTQSELLTESALRLFGLYQNSLPGIAQEIRFDVGKLLVSSASAKQEAEARKLMREGSVVSDAGSVASIGSVGSVGSIGMGGGFGQARGDVKGFDALSQVHVIQLLGDTAGWAWANKAGGSQYTYIYHLLQLYLETPHASTRSAAQNLLFRLLSGSVLFEHDPQEVDIWISNLPMALQEQTLPDPGLITERLHLLSFLDDCLRRCLRAPHKYMEDIVSLGKLDGDDRSSALPSPLLATALEQLQAKVAGHVIPGDAALAIVRYIRGIAVSMTRKGMSHQYHTAIFDKLVAAITAAEDTRDAKLDDIRRSAELGRKQFQALFSHTKESRKAGIASQDSTLSLQHLVRDALPGQAVEALEHASATDLASLLRLPWEWIALHVGPQHPLLVQYIDVCGPGAVPPIASVLVRLVHFRSQDAKSGRDGVDEIALLKLCLAKIGLNADVKRSIKADLFRDSALFGSEVRAGRSEAARVSTGLLDATSALDKDLAQPFIEACLHPLSGKVLERTQLLSCETWSAFMSSKEAQATISSVADAHAPETDWATVSSDVARVIQRLFERITDPAGVWQNLRIVTGLELYDIAADILRRSIPTSGGDPGRSLQDEEARWLSTGQTAGKVVADDLLLQLADIKPAAIEFVAASCSLSAAFADRVWREVLSITWTERRTSALSPILVSLARRGLSMAATGEALIPSLVKAFAAGIKQDQVGQVLVLLSRNEVVLAAVVAQVMAAEADATNAGRTPALLKLLADLTQDRADMYQAAALRVLEPALRWLVSQMSDLADLTSDCLQTIKSAIQVIERLPDASVSAYSAESVMLAVSQDRITSVEAISLAAALVPKSGLRAATIRQTLQSLVSSKDVARVANLDVADPLRRVLLKLYRVLCHASPYVACQPDLLEPMLAMYRGTTHSSDQDLLSTFKLFETYRKLSVSSIFKTWTGTGTKVDGEARRSLDVLTALDPAKVFAACVHFDANRSIDEAGLASDASDAPYDLVFLLSIAAMVLGEGELSGLDWVEILRSNILGAVVCTLSSRKESMRQAAMYVLGLAMPMIEACPFQERPAVSRTLRLLRHSIPASDDASCARLPRITTFFFAHVLRAIADPSSSLYPIASRFLLQRPTLDGKDVPMLYGMLYASGDDSKRDRRWMLRFIRDATQGQDDWHILRRRHTFALLATIFESTGEQSLRKLALEAMTSIVQVPSATYQLIDREGVLPWLTMQARSHNIKMPVQRQEALQIVEICRRLLVNLVHREQRDAAVPSSGDAVAEDKKAHRWMSEVEGFVRVACEQADLPLLNNLAECMLHAALCASATPSADTMLALIDRLRSLDKGLATSRATADDSWTGTVEALFRCRLEMPADAKTDGISRDADQWLKARILVCSGSVGDWARQEWMRGL